jgi:hypothetical protein
LLVYPQVKKEVPVEKVVEKIVEVRTLLLLQIHYTSSSGLKPGPSTSLLTAAILTSWQQSILSPDTS